MSREFVDTRRHPRYKMEVSIRIYPRNAAVVRGHSVEISVSGMSVMIRAHIAIGEVVRLEFESKYGVVEVHAVSRHREAFRLGFQFIEDSKAQEIINRTCRSLAIEEATRPTSAG